MRLIIRTDGTPEHTTIYLNDREEKRAYGVTIALMGGNPPKAKVYLPDGVKEFEEFVILPYQNETDLGFV